MSASPDRIRELLADEQLGQLSPEDAAELASLRADGLADEHETYDLGEMIVGFDRATHGADASDVHADRPSEAVTARLKALGHATLGDHAPPSERGRGGSASRSLTFPMLAAAATIAAMASGVIAWQALESKNSLTRQYEGQLAALRERIEDNDQIIAGAREAAATLRSSLDAREQQLADATDRNARLAEDLADATRDLDRARLTIARYETPVDPAVLAQNRRKLLEVPDTVRVEWQPFELAGAPAPEQPDVSGDVVWNDELQQGYLRFVGLDPNDPDIEQYQVWVIDERGLEQKVSGGVFDVTALGEVIVPIEPGIDVGRVALFAVTVEDSGGTWVPDLQRRVVVAPRQG